MIQIRQAAGKDIPALLDLLSQVLEVHAVIRPDLFVSGTRKYTEEELREILADPSRPVFVAEEDGRVTGYCFCVLRTEHSNCGRDSDTMYIDDLCVDEKHRGRHVGKALADYAADFAREKGCYDITLNVWEGNDAAMAFYRRNGYTVRKTMLEKLL